MRKWTIAAALTGACLLGVGASAELPPTLNPLRFNVYVSSPGAGINYSVAPLLDTETGKGSLTVSEADLGGSVAPGVEFDLQVDVDADPRIAYTFTLVNGTDAEIEVAMTLSTPMQPYDQAFDARHSLTVTANDLNGGGVTVTPNQFNFDRQDRTLQQAYSNGVDFLNPPFASSSGDFLGTGDLFSSDSPLGAGESTQVSGPKAVPVPDLFGLTPDGKFNAGAMNIAFKLSAGDSVTLQGELEIAKGLGGGGGGGGGGGDEPFGPYGGVLGGKLQAKAKKIASIKDKDFSVGVLFDEDTFSIQDGDTTVSGLASVKKGGKQIKLSLGETGKAQLAQLIASKLSNAVDDEVTVELTSEPKGKGSVAKDGAKSKLVFSAKYRATLGDSTQNGVYKISVKGQTSKP